MRRSGPKPILHVKPSQTSKLGATSEQTALRELFLEPLINYIRAAVDRQLLAGITATDASNTTLKDCLHIIFGVKYRDIVPCRALNAFKMLGLAWGDAGILDATRPDARQASVKKGAAMFVRIDERMPNRIDIELIHKGKHNSTMFTLTNEEYRQILPDLKAIDGVHSMALDAPERN